MPKTEDITIYAGDDQNYEFTVLIEDLGDLAEPTLTDATIYWWAARSKFSDPTTADIKKNSLSGGGIEITDVVERKFILTLNREDTLELIGKFYHEAKVVDFDGNASTVTIGKMTVVKTLVRIAGDP